MRRAAGLAVAAGLAAGFSAWLAACTPVPPSVAEIEAFLGAPLPPGRQGLGVYGEAGIDRLMLVRLEAPEAEAEAFAARLVPRGLEADEDAGIITFATSVEGWPRTLPAGARGGETIEAGRRAVKVVTAPGGPGLRRVWVAAFTL